LTTAKIMLVSERNCLWKVLRRRLRIALLWRRVSNVWVTVSRCQYYCITLESWVPYFQNFMRYPDVHYKFSRKQPFFQRHISFTIASVLFVYFFLMDVLCKRCLTF
jgi:hypothetical protein